MLKKDHTQNNSVCMKIKSVETELYHIPLKKPMADAIHGVQTNFSLIVVKMTTEDGLSSFGYTYSVGEFGGSAIAALIRDNLAPLIVGEDPRRIEAIWKKMWWAVHYAGRGGIAMFAMSAIDVALWDLKAKLADEPLWRFLGGNDNKVECYGGGIDFDMTIDQLLAQTQGFLDSGVHAIKMKIGRDSIAEECERIAAVRNLIGPENKLMVDVNMKWTVEKSLRAVRAFEPYDLYWIEEPTIPEDVDGLRRVETEGPIAVCTGENLRSIYEFRTLIADAGVSFPDADLSNMGGITAFMKVAHFAEAFNRQLTSHGIQEMHVSCLAAIPNASLLEIHAFRLDDFLVKPMEISDGYAYAFDTPGHGVELDWDKMSKHKIG